MYKTAEVILKVPFHDLDPMNIVWHGNYLKYIEVARGQLFDTCSIDLQNYFFSEDLQFPIIKTSLKYVFPLKYGDEFKCIAKVVDVKNKIKINFEIRLIENNQICAKGICEQAAVQISTGKLLFKIPDEIVSAFTVIEK
jgi:acyl-CoA thioester hydrolase